MAGKHVGGLDEEPCMVSVTHLTLWARFKPILIENEEKKWTEFMGNSGCRSGYFGFRS